MIEAIQVSSKNSQEPNLSEDHLDAVTYLPLIQAVFIKCGHSFNEDTAKGLVERNMPCPLDRKPFKKFYPNIVLRNVVQASLQLKPVIKQVSPERKEGPSPEAVAHFERGKKLFFANQYEEAVRAFLAALILHPTYEKAQLFFESALESQKKSPSLTVNIPPTPQDRLTAPELTPVPSSALFQPKPAAANTPTTKPLELVTSSQTAVSPSLQQISSNAFFPVPPAAHQTQGTNPTPLPGYVSLAFTPSGRGKALIRAIEENNLNAIAHLLTQQTFLNEKDGKNRTPLIVAAQMNKANILQILVANGAPIDADATSALVSATERGDRDVVQILVNGGVPLMTGGGSSDCMYRCTPLEIIAKKGDLELLHFFLSTRNDPNGLKLNFRQGYRPDERTVGDNAVIVACSNGHLDFVKCLIGAGVNLDRHFQTDKADKCDPYANIKWDVWSLREYALRYTGANTEIVNFLRNSSDAVARHDK